MCRTKKIIGSIFLIAIIIATVTAPSAIADVKGEVCPSCEIGSLYPVYVYTDWHGYEHQPCVHGLQGTDELQYRVVYVYMKCTNCSYQYLDYYFIQERVVCQGY